MGNESSTLVRFRRNGKETAKIVCGKSEVAPIYQKKVARRISSQQRYNSIDRRSPPTMKRETTSSPSIKGMQEYRRASTTRSLLPPANSKSTASQSNLLAPSKNDRRRSRSLCQTQMQNDVQELQKREKDKDSSSRKGSQGLIPSLNRLRIQQSFKGAKPQIGEWILKRASSSRIEFRVFLAKLDDEQIAALSEQTYQLIWTAVENIDRSEKVTSSAMRYGESFACLCSLGFRPDLFAVLADAAIAECVRLDNGAHKRCDTLLAWSQLFAAVFTSVRDGYYQRVRYQRRASLPQHSIVPRQTSTDACPSQSSRSSQDED